MAPVSALTLYSLVKKGSKLFTWLFFLIYPSWLLQPANAGTPEMAGNRTYPPSALTVYVFLATECPLSQNYTLTLNQLQQQYAGQGIRIVGVFPADDKQHVEEFVKKYGVQFEVVCDHRSRLTRQYHATVTPEAFLTDERNRVLYSGKIDDWAISLGKKKRAVTERYLAAAIRASLEGKMVKSPRTEPVGCLIELPAHTRHQRR